MYTAFNPSLVRQQFPALQKQFKGQPIIYADGPGGTQVPQMVVDAMMTYLIRDNSNRGGSFLNSQQTDNLVGEARRAMADFYNAKRPEEIVFGANMTTLTYALSRALSRTWQAGDEIILSCLDHNANIDPWLQAAADRHVTVRWLELCPDYTLDLESLPTLLNERTQLVAVTYASNAVGSIIDIAQVVKLAHTAGARVYVDAVHYAPHGSIDVQALGCDFLVSSTYKYYGPHIGVLYGKYALLNRLEAYQVRPAAASPPDKWETGTQSFEGLAGVRAAVEYLVRLGETYGSENGEARGYTGRRKFIRQAMQAIKQYEAELTRHFLAGATQIPGLHLYGMTEPNRIAERTPTFSLRIDQCSPQVIARSLARQGIFVWQGNFYAQTLMERLGLADGGAVRVGFVHYNTTAEVERVLEALKRLAP